MERAPRMGNVSLSLDVYLDVYFKETISWNTIISMTYCDNYNGSMTIIISDKFSLAILQMIINVVRVMINHVRS